ncbi:MAG: hypothetical protein MUC49_04675 [Raineya sp.]|jgi:hypothetical protein|nr:hypothetical protein [Raineya sp.]
MKNFLKTRFYQKKIHKIGLLICIWTFFLIPNHHILACDICGCGVGSYYFGVMPQYHKHFMGLRYRSMSFESHLNSQLLRTKEYFHTTELWGRFYPTSRVQIMGFVPYSFNNQVDINKQSKKIQGLNDLVLMANYNILNASTIQDTIVRKFKHSLWIGGGVKLPTGKYNYEEQDAGQVANPNFQLGTGSLDILTNLFYNVRYKNWGFNQDVSYKINTNNAKNYRFGNKISGNSNVFYIRKISKHLSLMPYAGIYFEQSALDTRNKEKIKETGGDLLASNAGMDVYWNQKLNIGVNYQIPLSQNLAHGEIRANNRVVLQASWLF